MNQENEAYIQEKWQHAKKEVSDEELELLVEISHLFHQTNNQYHYCVYVYHWKKEQRHLYQMWVQHQNGEVSFQYDLDHTGDTRCGWYVVSGEILPETERKAIQQSFHETIEQLPENRLLFTTGVLIPYQNEE